MPQFLTDDQKQIRDMVLDFAEKEVKPQRHIYDEENRHPTELVEKAKSLGLSGIVIPEEYGGLGYGIMELALLTEAMSTVDVGFTLAFGFTGLGGMPLIVGATDEQKKKWLPPIASGEHTVSFGLTEPGAGSDVPAMTTTAVKKGDKYVLNGTKQWITGAGVATHYTIFAITNPGRGPRGVSCFYVPADTPGLSFGKKEDKLGIRASETRQVIMEDMEIGEDAIVGRPGQGFLYALKTLNKTRPIVGAMGTGIQRGCIDESVKYSRERVQFGVKISTFQAIQHMLADMEIRHTTSQMVTYAAARAADRGDFDAPKLSAISKCYASDGAMQTSTDAIQIFGGYGFVKEYPVEKYFRDAKILQIFEGTNQIQRNEIASYVIKESAGK